MRISDWSSDVCSSDLGQLDIGAEKRENCTEIVVRAEGPRIVLDNELRAALTGECDESALTPRAAAAWMVRKLVVDAGGQIMLSDRSEEHTSELQSLMRSSYAVFCLKKKTRKLIQRTT